MAVMIFEQEGDDYVPRWPRRKSETKIYHVVLRSLDHQIIFEETRDYISFMEVLMEYKEKTQFRIYAYCMMDNHIHLLMKEGNEPLAVTMKRIEVKFVRWYNRKYDRSGPLFHSRYRSEPVESERYFRTVFCYIHQNPIKGGAEKKIGTYPWSSWQEYAEQDDMWIDIAPVIALFSSHEHCMEAMGTLTKDICLEDYVKRIPDWEALEIIKKVTSCQKHTDFLKFTIEEKNEYIRVLYNEGLSIRQLNRLTGISRGTIKNALA